MTTKETIIKILNCFENDSASPNTEYDRIYIYRDGPGKKKQVTLARGYTECGGSLWKVFQEYKNLSGEDSKVADKLLAYRKDSCTEKLPADKEFLKLIINTADSDDRFKRAQDIVYDEVYWAPGQNWWDREGFKLPLSLAVIQDSYLQSGGILDFLRKRFAESTPRGGGDEQKWISEYVSVRQEWLANHRNAVLHGTVYRTNFFTKEIGRSNWNLDMFPIYPNGSRVG